MSKMIRRAALVLVFGLAASIFTFAENGPREPGGDRTDIRQDYNHLRRDELSHNWRAVRHDRVDINRERTDLRHDYKDVRRDRREYRDRW